MNSPRANAAKLTGLSDTGREGVRAPPNAPADDPVEPDFFSPQVSKARRFFLSLNPPKDRALAVVCGGYENCTAEYAIERETFPFYTLEYVAAGQGDLKLKNRRHALQPGSLFTYGPGVPHRITGDRAHPLVKYFVNFAGTGAANLLNDWEMSPGTASHVFPSNALQGLFEELIASGIRGTSRAARLCSKLVECLGLKIMDSRIPLEAASTPSFTSYQSCRQHIQENFPRLKTLGQIARECHLDGSYLCRLFRRYDHESPYRYLMRLKMNCAAELLLRPGAMVKQVSASAGFANPFHFSRAFKQVLGLSPDRFRRLR
jgi:AraC-like DNA-binding protein